jgi:hypothetical protein
LQVYFDPNNIHTYLINSGIFNQNIEYSNMPGFEWPAGSGKYAIFTSGLTLGGYVNGQLRTACASYKGEYAPGYITKNSGVPVAVTDYRFKFYKIKRGDNINNNPDWFNWQMMVPFGAPFVDVNHNGVYEPFIDTPGIKGAQQTIFICMTDGFPYEHKIGEGFGGGTLPMFAEVHMTAWGYDNPGYEDMQFIKWEIINKNVSRWDSVHASVISDVDLGAPYDDYTGCDSIRKLIYCYNITNYDDVYGENPPAVGMVWLNCGQTPNIGSPFFVYFDHHGVLCETDPNGEAQGAYNFIKGVKKDGTPWVVPNTNPPQTTKFCYSGDPETATGWTAYTGQVQNCGGLLTGPYVVPVPMQDRRWILSSGPANYIMNPNDTIEVIISQLIARGTSNLNSVTKLKQLTDRARELCNNGFIIGVENLSNEVPKELVLYQNYPNPFNPSTKIKFSISAVGIGRDLSVQLKVYDLLGREVATLVNEQLKPGTYEIEWNGSNYASSIYFYKLHVGDLSESKKMILLK